MTLRPAEEVAGRAAAIIEADGDNARQRAAAIIHADRLAVLKHALTNLANEEYAGGHEDVAEWLWHEKINNPTALEALLKETK